MLNVNKIQTSGEVILLSRTDDSDEWARGREDSQGIKCSLLRKIPFMLVHSVIYILRSM